MPGRIGRTSGVRESPVCMFRERAVPSLRHSNTEGESDGQNPDTRVVRGARLPAGFVSRRR